MCGIVGYVGRESRCVEVLLEGLRHLEYRGYDSAGLALQRSGRIERVRRVGHLENLERAVRGRNGDYARVTTGVGHTRWATHGRPSEENAHPHLGGSGAVAVVHNGIIENFAALRSELEDRGVRFASETDTEVVAHLLEERVLSGASLREALAGILPRLEGTFAIAAISREEPGRIVAARHQSPLVIGLGEGESFLASAIPALLGQTRRFLLVENGEVAELTAGAARLFGPDGAPVEREVFEVDWDAEAVELGGFESYMLKEIHEQPAALRATLAGLLGPEGEADTGAIGLPLREVRRVVVVACGTAYHAGLLGKAYIERLAGLPAEVSVASEYRYSEPVGDGDTLVVAISQSGETIDTLAAIQAARRFGGRVLAITNTRGSLITREADAVLLTSAGPEIGVAATKTFLAQIAALQALALALAAARKTLPEGELLRMGRGLRRLPERVEEAIGLAAPAARQAAALFESARCALFLGRGPAYPVALEGALKLKEISYVPAEGYPAGEMKHGPIALVDERCPVVAVLGEGLLREKTLSNVEETVARGAPVIAVAGPGDGDARRLSGLLLPVPEEGGLLGPYLWTVPLQLLAYHVARARGLDVDKPRNLAKSVTVE